MGIVTISFFSVVVSRRVSGSFSVIWLAILSAVLGGINLFLISSFWFPSDRLFTFLELRMIITTVMIFVF